MKIGLVLSHIFVREGESEKFSWVEKAIERNREFKQDFHIVLCGHGIEPTEKIKKLVDEILWDEQIDEKQLGTGHPVYCIKGFKACINAGCARVLKNRAYDYITNKDILQYEFVLSEQTDLNEGIIGDLFMYGDPKELLHWWTVEDWDYGPDGLRNLYAKSLKIKGLTEKAVYLNPEQLGWKTLEFNSDKYWGQHMQNPYRWWGGNGIKKI